ncbi:MAG: YfjI family protein [Verrucomicrobiales bacterium]
MQTPQEDRFLEPRPLPDPNLAPVEQYTLDLLPESVRPWIADEAERGQFPVGFLIASFFSTMGAAIGRRCAVYPKRHDHWYEYPNLWCCIIGRPGTMKSPSLNAMLAPLRAIEKQHALAYEQDLADFQKQELRTEIAFKAAKKIASNSASKGEPFDTPERESLEEPTCRRILTSDATEEKLGDLLMKNPEGLILELDELATLDGMFEKNPSFREFMLKAWNGKSAHQVDRIGRGEIRIEALCLTVIGGIQPSRIASGAKAASNQGGDGLLQRFQLVAFPDGHSDPWRYVDKSPDLPAKEAVFSLFNQISAMRPADFPKGPIGLPPGLHFDTGAQEVWQAWQIKIMGDVRGGDDAEALEAFKAKAGKAVAALALVFELCGDPNALSISKPSLSSAIALYDISESHFCRLLSASDQRSLQTARLIAAKLKEGKLDHASFTAREIKQKGWKGLTESAAVEEGLAVLVECNWLSALKVGGAGQNGRPTFFYSLWPAALTQLEEI